MKMRSAMLWLLAFLITAASAVYQRVTGPTYPVRGRVTVGAAEVEFKLLRTHDSTGDAEIRIEAPDQEIRGDCEFKRYPSQDEWQYEPLAREADRLVARIPKQPPAGKVLYRIRLASEQGTPVPLTEEPVIIRFKGHVPGWALHPHILGMVLAMLFAARAGLEAFFKRPQTYWMTVATVASLLVGGMIFGPIVQKFAFGEFWTGFPLGYDLTDNKSLIATLVWLVALWRVRKNRKSRGWIIAAALFTFAIWMIPHSVLGSELDYTTLPQ
ncbi:MAG: hypothetical protein ABII12_02645 [Planctomycetota bacterium]